MKGNYPIEKFRRIETPFYYYDLDLLRETISSVKREAQKYDNFCVHYAIKANANPKILKTISKAGLGADCVSGWEVTASVEAGFPPNKIVFAGVGKTDKEIALALSHDIFCFNVESEPELQAINTLAKNIGKTAHIALRVNPNIGAHTHANITTGLAENKFGINMEDLGRIAALTKNMSNIELIGLHFHIGSQILDMSDFMALCNRINDLQSSLARKGIVLKHINVGGGLGVDYKHPNMNPVPDFASYFAVYGRHLKLYPGQTLHFELGRSLVAQCGSLISSVTYVKQGTNKQFAILDAGMTDLIRPALYQAYHKIENITSNSDVETYDVVGPICESSDVFAHAIDLNHTNRGDLLAIRSAGAYGEIMASQYNCRPLAKSYTSDEI